jgi:hypothetical protein
VFAAGSAKASASFEGCNTGGTHVDVILNWHNVNSNTRDIDNWSWATTPPADLNRIQVDMRENGGAIFYSQGAAGGSTSTLNDVPDSEANYDPGFFFSVDRNNSPQWRATVWGGVGNSTDSCNTGWHSM